MINPRLEEEYKNRVRSGHIINWDFWVPKGGYVKALKKAISVIKMKNNQRMDWDERFIQQLLTHAKRVRDLNEKNSKAFELWDELYNATYSLLVDAVF